MDFTSFATVVMPEVRRRIEAALHPLAAERGLKVACQPGGVKTAKRVRVEGLSNLTWRARKGLKPGFTVELVHSPKNYLHVEVSGKPFYPAAYAAALLLGSLISIFWIPYLFAHFSELTSNPLFIALVLLSALVFFFAVAHEPIVAFILAVLSTVAFGFIAGFAIGWGMSSLSSDRKHAARIRPALAAVLAGLDEPSAPSQLIAPFAPAGRGLHYAAPAAAAPLAVAAPSPAVPPAQGTAPCPKCANEVAIGAPWCAWCGLDLAW